MAAYLRRRGSRHKPLNDRFAKTLLEKNRALRSARSPESRAGKERLARRDEDLAAATAELTELRDQVCARNSRVNTPTGGVGFSVLASGRRSRAVAERGLSRVGGRYGIRRCRR